MNFKQLLFPVLVLLVLFFGSILARHIILDGLPVTKLADAPALAGSIAPALTDPNSATTIPQIGKDFEISSTHYLDNKQWVIASVKHLPDMNAATLVLQKQHSIYVVVLGPGTIFSASDIQTAPPEVIQYLYNEGLVND
jgi:hypothetical protein